MARPRPPTAVRYEASIVDGFEAPADGIELFNRITVRYKDVNDEIENTSRSQTVAVLDNAVAELRKVPAIREAWVVRLT